MEKNNRIRWAGLVTAGVLAAILAGCGGGDSGATGATGGQGPTGPTGPTGPAGPVGAPGVIQIASNATPATDASVAAWKALDPTITITSVEITSAAEPKPVVRFKVTNVDGGPVIGLGNTTPSGTLRALPNLAFSIAKLVPAVDGAPSRWVSYIVTTTAATPGPTRPTTDNTGTLVDNGDGTYQYTFYRDITAVREKLAAVTTMTAADKIALGGDANLTDLTYTANSTHRVTIQLSGNAPGTGTNTATGTTSTTYPASVPLPKPYDAIYDFVPATGQAVASTGRDIVANAKCEECHRQLGGIPGDASSSSAALFHGGSRNEVRYCVVCHTEQRKYGRAEVTYNAATLTLSGSAYVMDGRTIGNLPNFIHKIHAGHSLAKQNYDYAGVKFNHVGYPQDIRNCTKCHDGSDTSTAKTAQGDNWKNAANRLACGSCHDGINFATGTGVTLADANAGLTTTNYQSTGFAHPPGPLADDSLCTGCHKPAGIDANHLPVTPPNLASALHVAGGSANTNAAWIASNTSRLPAGAIKISYDIKSISRNASKQPVMVFRILQNGARKDFNVLADTTVDPLTGDKEMWPNFMGSPSAYFVFSVPQDGIAAPADFNASVSGYLKNIWKGTATGTGAGTLSAPDGEGYYTLTLTGVVIPDNAKMLTGGLGYSYNVSSTLPLTQTNVAGYPVLPSPVGAANEIGGLVVITPNSQKVAAGYTGRRPIVEDARCNACHQEMNTFTEEAFHGGQRNDGTTCSWCHNPNRPSQGWSVDSTAFVHAIHAGAKRKVPYTYYAASATEGFFDIGYPGVLKDCETCHLAGTYDFSASASAAALPNRPYRTVVTGTLSSTSATAYRYPNPAVDGQPAYFALDTAYGSGFSFSAATGTTTEAAATTLVTSPIATSCFSCHDSLQSRAHIEANGGSLYKPRSTALATVETCSVCHEAGRVGDIRAVHKR